MSVLVVGAAGTVGTFVTRSLGWRGIDVRASAPDSAFAEVRGASVIINLSGPRVRQELVASDYLREHVGIAARIVRTMRPDTHLVHVSSTSVFGRRGACLSADALEDPSSFPFPDYAAAKLAAETYVRAEAPARGVRLTVLRPSMIYGEGIDSALATLLRAHRAHVPLALRPRRIRQHLTSGPLLLEALRTVVETPMGPSPLLIVDPFVLTNADLDPRSLLAAPVNVESFAKSAPARGRAAFWRNVVAVLGVDNEFESGPSFARMRLDPVRFGRDRVFTPYWQATGR